ncbi:MAG: DUF6291 domain-containing protein [Lentisphaerota bacterium]
MSKESFLMYLSFNDPAQLLTDIERGQLWSAVFEYAKSGQEIELPLPVKIAFAYIREHLKRDNQKYKNICLRNTENIKKRWDTRNTTGKSGIPKNTRNTHTDSDSDSDNTLILSGDVSPVTAYSFEQFWKIYDKPADRVKCMSKFKKLSAADKELIRDRLPGYVASSPDVQFRKNPLTYLNGKCWQDEAATPEARKCAL